jgi:hypothetical protein
MTATEKARDIFTKPSGNQKTIKGECKDEIQLRQDFSAWFRVLWGKRNMDGL